jgi:hypothetical protein
MFVAVAQEQNIEKNDLSEFRSELQAIVQFNDHDLVARKT